MLTDDKIVKEINKCYYMEWFGYAIGAVFIVGSYFWWTSENPLGWFVAVCWLAAGGLNIWVALSWPRLREQWRDLRRKTQACRDLYRR